MAASLDNIFGGGSEPAAVKGPAVSGPSLDNIFGSSPKDVSAPGATNTKPVVDMKPIVQATKPVNTTGIFSKSLSFASNLASKAGNSVANFFNTPDNKKQSDDAKTKISSLADTIKISSDNLDKKMKTLDKTDQKQVDDFNKYLTHHNDLIKQYQTAKSTYTPPVEKPGTMADYLPSSIAENFPFVGSIMKTIHQEESRGADNTLPLATVRDAITAIPKSTLEVGQGFVKSPIQGASEIPNLLSGGKYQPQVHFTIPGIGEVTNSDYRIAQRIDNGEDPVSTVLAEKSQGLLDALFFAGIVSKGFTPRTVVTNTAEIPGEPFANDAGAFKANAPKSFREYTPPSSATPLSSEFLAKMKTQGVDLGAKFDPKSPTFFRVTLDASSKTFKGEIVQVKPSWFDTIRAKFGGDLSKAPKDALMVVNTPKEVKTTDIQKASENPRIEAPAKSLQHPEGAQILHTEIKDALETHGVELTHQALQDNLHIDAPTATSLINEVQSKEAMANPNRLSESLLPAKPEVSLDNLFGEKVAPKQEEKSSLLSVKKISSGLDPAIEKGMNINDPKIQGMVKALKEGKDLPPIPVYVKADGTYELNKDGAHRLIAYREAGIENARVNIQEKTDLTSTAKQTQERAAAHSEPLANEAKKYKSAEEFVSQQEKTQRRIVDNENRIDSLERQLESTSRKDSDVREEISQEISDLKSDNSKYKDLQVEGKSKEELTDIYKEATKRQEGLKGIIDAVKSTPESEAISKTSRITGFEYNPQSGFISTESLTTAIDGVADFIKNTNRGIEASKNLDDSLYVIEKNAEADKVLALQLVEKTTISPEDAEAIYHYREDHSLPLTSHQKALYDNVSKPLQREINRIASKLKETIPISEDDRNSRYVKGKGNVIDRIKKGAKGIGGKGSVLGKSAPSLKKRTMKILTDKDGNRTVVSIKDGKVTAFKDKEMSDLGTTDKKVNPKVKEFYDDHVYPVLDKAARDLGIKHTRHTAGSKGLGPNTAGVSFQGLKHIKTRSATPERVLLHELGHQIDQHYGLKDIFLKSKSEVKTPRDEAEYAKLNLEIMKDAVDSHPAKGLSKYANKNGELPEVTGKKGKSEFARTGDQIVTEYGFQDSEQAREAYKEYVELRSKYLEAHKEFRENFKSMIENEKARMEEVTNIQNELRALADLRIEGMEIGKDVSHHFAESYIRNADEKMAVMFEAYLHVPERFKEVAPTVYENFINFLGRHEELKPILDLKPSLVLGSKTFGGEHVRGTLGNQFIDKTGKQYTVGEATTKEIEQHSDTEYHKNFFVNDLVTYLNLRQVERATDFLEAYKESPEFESIGMKIGEGEAPKNWTTTVNPSFRGYMLDPHVAEIMDKYASSAVKGKDPLKLLTSFNGFLRSAIFFNPFIHVPNIGVHWLVNRGAAAFVNPKAYKTLVSTSARAINAVIHQNEDYVNMLQSGAPLLYSTMNTRNLHNALLAKMTAEIDQNPALDFLKKAMKAINPYVLSGKATWMINDVATMQAIYEEMENGQSTEEAIKNVGAHIPNYRVPAMKIMQLINNPNITMFGAYHFGALRSYYEMAKTMVTGNEAGSEHEGGDKWKARAMVLDKLLMLGIIALVIYPAIDKAIQDATGNPNAKIRRAGAVTFPYNLAQMALGNMDISQFVQAVFTPAVGSKELASQLFNVDMFTGQHIRDTTANAGEQAKEAFHHAETAVAPIAQYKKIDSGVQSGTQFGLSLVGVSSPDKVRSKLANAVISAQAKVDKLNKASVDKVRPYYEQAKALGFGTPEADAVIKDLSSSDMAIYKDLKAVDIAKNETTLQQKVQPIVEQAYKLGFGTPEADKLVADLSPEEQAAYTKIKTVLYGANGTGAPVFDAGSVHNDKSILGTVAAYANAVRVDPLTAFERIFTGQRILRTESGAIIVERNDKKEASYKKELGGTTEMTLDHLKSFEIGGDNRESNMWLIPKDIAAQDDKIENILGRALSEGKIDGKQAQEYEVRYKKQADAAYIDARTKATFDGVGDPLTFDQVKELVK